MLSFLSLEAVAFKIQQHFDAVNKKNQKFK
jgi:hypothetical protein